MCVCVCVCMCVISMPWLFAAAYVLHMYVCMYVCTYIYYVLTNPPIPSSPCNAMGNVFKIFF